MDPVTLALAKSWAEGQFGDLRQLQQHIAALQAVSELAPYVQAILDSRIVDHNLDVADPPNGRYVRWENGLQICAGYGTHSRTDGARWTYPAAFIAVPYVLAVPRYKSAWRAFMVLISTSYLSNTAAAAAVYDTTGSGTQAETDTVELYWFAMGRWK